MRTRDSQLSLRLGGDLLPALPDSPWQDGVEFQYLGTRIILRLDTDRKDAMLDGDTLHLPLPPAATPRQIQDGVEAWLRREATRLIGACIERQSHRQARPVTRWALSFSARSDWAQSRSDGSLRCNWRLIEQPAELIEQAIGHALSTLPAANLMADLWEVRAA